MINEKTELFIEKAKKIHGNKYDYSLVNYIKSSLKIKIICKKHGVMEQTPNNHLRGQGCHKCCGKYKLSQEEFIEKVCKIHNNFYSYENINYINNHTKINITCPKHGSFYQNPNNHLQGLGCRKCGKNEPLNTELFIKKAKEIHGDKYIYEKVNYTGINKKVSIICPIHGKFNQTSSKHLIGRGCEECGGSRKLTTEEFIIKADEIHNGLYEYTDVNYYNNNTKVKIKCNKHGIFNQKAGNHLLGKGCPVCKKSKGELKVGNLLKENNIKYKPQYTFSDLKYKDFLKFDFGVLDEDGNLLYLIEYNGQQHYIYNNYFHKTIENFIECQLRDKMKKDYCIKNIIPLYIIRYDEDIESKICEMLIYI